MPDSKIEIKFTGIEDAEAFTDMLQRWEAISKDNNRLLRESIELQRKYNNELNNTNRARRSAPRRPSEPEAPPPRYTQDWQTVYGPPVKGARGRYERGEPLYSRAPREAATYPRSPVQQAEYERQQRTKWAQQERQARSTSYDPFKKMDWSTPRQRATTDQFKGEWAKQGEVGEKQPWIKPQVKEIFDKFHKDTSIWAKALPDLGRIALQLYSLTKFVAGGGKAVGGLGPIERLIFGEYALRGGSKGGGLLGALFNLGGAAAGAATKTAAGTAAVEGLNAVEVAEVAAPAAAMLLKRGLVVGGALATAGVAGFELYYTLAQATAMRGRRARGYGYGANTGAVSAADADLPRYNLDPDTMLSAKRSAKYDIESDAYFGYKLAGVNPDDLQATQKMAQWWSNYAKQPRFKGRGAAGLMPMARATGVLGMFGEAGAVTLAEETKPIQMQDLEDIKKANLSPESQNIVENQLSAIKMFSEQIKVFAEDKGPKLVDAGIALTEDFWKLDDAVRSVIGDFYTKTNKEGAVEVTPETPHGTGPNLNLNQLPDVVPNKESNILGKAAGPVAFEEGGARGSWILPGTNIPVGGPGGTVVRGGEGGGITLPPGAVAGGGTPVGGGSVRPAEPLHNLLVAPGITGESIGTGGAPLSIRARGTSGRFAGGVGSSGLGPGAGGRGGGATATDGTTFSGVAASGDFIKKQEGLVLHPYSDVGHQAIGYGHDFTPQELAQGYAIGASGARIPTSGSITKEQASDLFKGDYQSRLNQVSKQVPGFDKLNSNQQEAVMSYYYNTGRLPSGLAANVKSGNMGAISSSLIGGINTVHGVPNAVLTRRRAAEGRLFSTTPKASTKAFAGGGGTSGGGGASGGWADTSTKADSIDADFFKTRGGKRSEGLNPEFSSRLESAVGEAEKATGEKAQFTSLVRTREEQAKLYYNYIHHIGGQGLAAAPGTSLHEKGFASDLASGKTRDYVMAHLGKYGLEGVRGDPEHLQLSRALRDQETAKAIQDRTPRTQEAKDRTFAPSGGPHQRSPGPMSMNNMNLFQQNKSQNLTIYNKSGANVNAQSAMLGLSAGSFMS